MQTPADPLVLWSRASAVASVAFLLGLVGHVTAGGLLPPVPVLGLLLAAAVALSVPLLDRQASRVRLVAMVVGGQTALHVALTVLAGHAGDPRSPTAAVLRAAGDAGLPRVDGRRSGSLLDAYGASTGAGDAPVPAVPLGSIGAELSAHAPMMLAHVAVAVAVGLWLAHGERCLWTLIALGARPVVAAWRLRSFVPVAVPAGPVPPRDTAPAARRTTWRWLPDPVRGPPASPA